MSTLYNLTDDYVRVLEMIDEGVDEAVIQDTLESIDDAIEFKADNYSHVIREKEGINEIRRKEVKRIQELINRDEKAIKLMKESLYEAMKETGKTKFKTDLNSFWIQKSPPTIEVKSEDNIPEKFFKTERKLQRRDLIKYMKENSIEGVELKQTEGVRIR